MLHLTSIERSDVWKLRTYLDDDWKPDPVRLIVIAEGWAMIHRKGCGPFIISEDEWNRMEPCEAP